MNVEMGELNFLKNVEDGHQDVYPEKVTGKILAPLLFGGIISIFLTAIYMIYWDSFHVVSFFSLILPPILIGIVITLGLGKKMLGSEGAYGVRGINRILLSQAIHFLDMLSQGEADVGKIVDDQKPDEHAVTPTIAFGAAFYVLKKVDSELAKMWLSSLQEKLRPETSSKSIWLIRITLFGTIGLIPIVIVLEIMRRSGIISTELAFPLIIGSFGIVIVLVAILSIYALKSSRDGVPEGVRIAISEPQVRLDTERALEKLIDVIKTEGKYPLRVLVLGEHEELTYTNRVYVTSKGFTLRAAVLIPDLIPQ